jgi:hypothetical protein
MIDFRQTQAMARVRHRQAVLPFLWTKAARCISIRLGDLGAQHCARSKPDGRSHYSGFAKKINVMRLPRFRLGPRYYLRMVQRQKWREVGRMVATAVIEAGLGAALLAASVLAADARGGHGFGRGLGGHGMHGTSLAGDRRHANDAYTKAASDEHDQLLNKQIKSICRGC